MRSLVACGMLNIGAVMTAAPFAWADGIAVEAGAADVVFLGEQHDNAEHHAIQADWVARLAPSALVFEMLTPAQAARITPDLRGDPAALEAVLDWQASGWPDFGLYYPIFEAAPDAGIYGAGALREEMQAVIEQGLAAAAGEELSARFDLALPLLPEEQSVRETHQAAAHCDALPPEMLPGMVAMQRLRDAALAGAALDALRETGGPVVVIAGNGHVRRDWGAPFLLNLAAPEVAVFALGQGEDGALPDGGFDAVADASGVDRGDPCSAFR